MHLITVAVLTSAGGAFTKEIQPEPGRLLQVRYVPDASTPLDTGADVSFVGKTSGLSYFALTDIGTSAFNRAIRQPTHGQDGVASLYAVGQAVNDYLYLGGEAVTFTVAQGGNAKLGKFYLWVD